MARLFGYHLIWTTYGTWLQGDKRGYVRNGKILDGDESLFELCKKLQADPAFRLRNHEKKIVRTAITNESERIGRTGKIWTTGFYKTFCFTPAELASKVKYIRKHNI